MTDRIIDLSESAAYLRVENRQLVIEREGHDPVSVPLAEVAAVIAAHPQVQCSQPVLAELAAAGGVFIVCDKRSMPVGMMLPLVAHKQHTRRVAIQAETPLPTKKRLWKQIVQRKITAQADLLRSLRGDDRKLPDLVSQVRAGDPTNREAVAAKRYWSALFADKKFRRRFDEPDANRLLNYGYAVLRAVMGRAICGTGLHPALGLHHHHRENPFCLADDLLEPYRPLIDVAVVRHQADGHGDELDRSGKEALLGAILCRYDADGEARTLFDLCARTARSLAKCLEGKSERLEYPKQLRNAST